jgi:sulfonate transport system substrate-binding protein
MAFVRNPSATTPSGPQQPGRRTALRTCLAGLAAWTASPALKASSSGGLPAAIRVAGGASSENGKLRLGGLAHVVDEQGWLSAQLRERGVALEWFTTAHAATGPMINEGFANGSVDFAGYGDLPATILNAGGVQTRLVMPHGLGSGEGYLVVPAGSTARSITDLKGKRLAIHRGRPWEMPLLRLLQSHGLKYSDFKLFNINPEAGMAAIAAGQMDGLFTTTSAFLLEDRGVGRIIWSTKQADLDWKTRTDFFVAKRFVDRWPELTQIVVSAYVRAAHWASRPENQEALIQIAANNGTPVSVVRRSYADARVNWKDRWSPLFNDVVAHHYRRTVDFALEHRLIGRPFDVNALQDRRFVQQALAEQKLAGWWQPVPPPASGAPGAPGARGA